MIGAGVEAAGFVHPHPARHRASGEKENPKGKGLSGYIPLIFLR